MIDTGLEGKVALVTGANHGIGAATAKALAAQGARVFITYLRLPYGNSAEETGQECTPGEALYRARQAIPADKVVKEIRERGGYVEAWESDLSDPASVPELFDRAEHVLGPVRVLVNNAAVCEPDTFVPSASDARERQSGTWVRPTEMSAESHDRHFAVNSRAAALMMAEYARRHTARGATWGRIVNVSTDAAQCFPGEISYGASKAALEAYSRSAAKELAQFGITVNVVSPGPTQTGYIAPRFEETLVPDVPLGRLGRPEDLADVIVFLASEQARWVTGQLLYVGGGHEL